MNICNRAGLTTDDDEPLAVMTNRMAIGRQTG